MMQMKSKRVPVGVLVLTLVLSVLLSACGSQSTEPTQQSAAGGAAASQASAPKAPRLRDELKVRVGIDISNLVPGRLNGSTETAVAFNLYSGLLKFKQGTTEVVPDLAENWNVSPDGKTYTFHLRKGVKWHKNHGELTSQDVKASFEWIRKKENASPFLADFSNVEKIETPDPYTVTIQMKNPQPSFSAAVLAYRPGLIMKQEVVEKSGKEYNANAIGTGPYRLEQWIPGDRIVLRANPEYFGEKPKTEKVTFLLIKEEATFEAALEKGDVDIGYTEDGTVGGRLARNKSLKAQTIAGPRTWYLQFNLKKQPFQNPRVRQAIWWALNKDELVEGVFGGAALATDTLLNTWVFGRLEERPYKQDQAKAKELLKQAGLEGGLKTTLHTYTTATAPDQAAIIKEHLAKVGIEVDIKVVEWANLTQIRRGGNFEISLQPQLRLDSDQYFTQLLHSSSSPYPNSGGYAGLDGLIDRARTEMDDAKRKDLYYQIQRQVHQDVPVIPLVHPSFVLAYRPNVKGAVAANLTYNLPDISVED